MDVDAEKLLGEGIQNLVSILAQKEDRLHSLALSLGSVTDAAGPDGRHYVLTGLQALRALLCGVHCTCDGWAAFRAGLPPKDAGRKERQEHAARSNVVTMALQFVGHPEPEVGKEALLLLEAALAGEQWNSGLRVVQEALWQYLQNDAERLQFCAGGAAQRPPTTGGGGGAFAMWRMPSSKGHCLKLK